MDHQRSLRRLAGKFLQEFTSPGLEARHAEWSVISSHDDLAPAPTAGLINLALAAGKAAQTITLDSVRDRVGPPIEKLVATWPGEHYRFLAGLTRVLAPDTVVEIGTYTGLGALSLAAGCEQTRVYTFDVVDQRTIKGSALTPADARIECCVADLSHVDTFRRYLSVLDQAEIIFIDGPKDGIFERRFAEILLDHFRNRIPLLVFDDTRVMNMVEFWRWLPIPKFDATSLGHWSGTGLATSGKS